MTYETALGLNKAFVVLFQSKFNEIEQSKRGQIIRAIAKNGRLIEPVISTFNELNKKTTNDYAARDSKGNIIHLDNGSIKIDPARVTEYKEMLESHLNAELDVEIKFEPLSFADICVIQELTPEITFLLEPILTD